MDPPMTYNFRDDGPTVSEQLVKGRLSILEWLVRGGQLEAKQLAYDTSMTGVTDKNCCFVPAFSDKQWSSLYP